MILLAVALLCLGPTWSTLTFEKAGWLDRMVAYHKKMFFKDVDQMPPEPIIATLAPMPPGYEDSKAWDFDSVMRLITLVHASDSAGPVRRAIRRALAPTRRLALSKGRNSFKLFPSLAKNHPNYIYYDGSMEYYTDDLSPGNFNISEDSVVVVSNPVEARLPSAQISVRLLKEIMEARAEAAREMPSTTKATFEWKNMTKKVTAAGADTPTAGGSPGAEGGNATTAEGGAATIEDGGATTDTPAPES